MDCKFLNDFPRVVIAAVFDQYNFKVKGDSFNRRDDPTVQFW